MGCISLGAPYALRQMSNEHKSHLRRALDANASVHGSLSVQHHLCVPDLNIFAGPEERPQLAGPSTTGEKSEIQSKARRRKEGDDPWDCLALEDRQGGLGGQFSPALLP